MADNKSDISINSLYNRSVGIPYSAGTEIVAIGAASARSTAALRGNGTFLISTDTTCHVNFGDATNTAATTDHIMFAGSEWIVHTGKGTGYYVAVIQSSASGNLYITELLGDRLG